MALASNEIRLEDVRLSFPKLWTPEPFPGGQDPTAYFSAAFILAKGHPQIKALEAMMTKLASEKWGARGPAVLKAAKAVGKVFLRDGDSKPEVEGYEGNWFVSARSKTRPNTFDGQRNTVTEADGVIYGGCYVNAIISCYAYVKGNNGLGAGLKGVQFKRKGDAFSGGGTPAESDDFDEIAMDDADPLTA
jgi:hypothetical protein